MEENKENSSAPNLNESGKPKRKFCAKNQKNIRKGRKIILVRKCALCGNKIFMHDKYRVNEYVYKQDGKIFCSWGCMRQWESEHSGKITAQIMAEIEAYTNPEEIKALKDEARIKARLMKKW